MWVGWLLACAGGSGVGSGVQDATGAPPPDTPGPTAGGGGGGCRDDGAGRDDAFLYGDETLDFTLELTDAAIAGLATSPDEVVPDVPAVFTYGTERYDVGLHLRGGAGSFQTFDGKPGFALDFGYADPDARFHGVRYLTLKNNVQDPSMLAEHAAYALDVLAGAPAPRHGFARVTVDGEPFGLYTVIEAVGSTDFVARCFGDASGALYEGQIDDLEEGLVDGYDVILDGPLVGDPRAPLRAATAALDGAKAGTVAAAIDAELEIGPVLANLAVEFVTGNPDGYVAWRNNYYLYEVPDEGRLAMIAWGPDQAFREDLAWDDDYEGRLWKECRADATCEAKLRAAALGVAETMRSGEWRDWLDAEAGRTEDDCLDDPRSPWGADGCAAGRDALLAFLDARPDEVEAQLGE